MSDQSALFLYGTLRHLPLLQAVAGGDVAAEAAWLVDHVAHRVVGADYPMIVPKQGWVAEGLLIRPTADQKARLDFYEGGHGYGVRQLQVNTEDGSCGAEVYWHGDEMLEPAEPWDLHRWSVLNGPRQTIAAREAIAMFGRQSPRRVQERLPSLLTRAQAAQNAASPAPTTLRRSAEPSDVEVRTRTVAYADFFSVEEYRLRHRKFDGQMSPELHRSVFVSGDAATVLPYDPVRDRVLLVEQFRMGIYGRGDPQPWSLEAIAGRVDPGETPRETVLREAREEAGLELARLIELPGAYPSPAAKTEFVFSFIGIADLPDSAAGTGGMASEDEDIRAHVISFEDLMHLLDTGEVANGPLALSALYLARKRPDLQAERQVVFTRKRNDGEKGAG